MKNFKKLLLALGILLIGSSVIALRPPAVLAASTTETPADIAACLPDLLIVDAANITCTDAHHRVLTFVDRNPADGTENYAPTASESNYFCDPGGLPSVASPQNEYGINPGNSGSDVNGPADLGQAVTIDSYINIGTQTNGGGCTRYNLPSGSYNEQSLPVSGGNTGFLQWTKSGNEVVSLNNVTQGPLSGEAFLRVKDTTLDPSNASLYVSDGIDVSKCSGQILSVPNDSTVGSTAAMEYSLASSQNSSGTDVAAGSISDLQNIAGGSNCVVSTNFGTDISTLYIAGSVPASFKNSGTGVVANAAGCSGSSCNSQICTTGLSCSAGDANNAPAATPCDQNSGGWSLSWLACPVLDAASGLTNTLIGVFEGQLSFSVSQLDPNGGASKLHQSWSLVSEISTALVVVLMLIMVFSQALSFGPFDAYTVRKMLPKLVAAVILIQLSWSGVSWLIDLVNDVARAIADIMYYPFGGATNMDIWHLLANAKLTTGLLSSLNWAALTVFIALGVAFLFTMLGVALVTITSLFFAIITLVFRKVLLILLLIFAPLALLAWVMPGTEKYWKLWRENLLKALAMFPIAVAIIAAGRIFAYVVGSQDNGQFLNLIFVLVGFFGPLFILPKTFKWGGQAMQAAGNGIMKASTKVSERPKKLMDARQEEWAAERKRQSAERVATHTGFNPLRPWRLPLDKIKSGDWDPTRGIIPKGRFNPEGSRRRQKAHDTYVEAGEKSHQEDVSAAEARIVRERQAHRAAGGDHDLYLQAIADGLESYEDPRLGHIQLGKRNSVERTAARKQLAKLGAGMNWRYLENYYEQTRRHGTNEQRAEMRKFFDDNVDTILPKMPHIYKSIVQAADQDPGSIAQMHGVEVEAVLSNLTNELETGKTWDDATRSLRDLKPPEMAERQNSLTKFLQNFQRAVENAQRGGPQLENGALRAVKGFLEGGSPGADVAANKILRSINDDGIHGRRAPYRGHQDPDRDTPPPMPGEDRIDLFPLKRAQDLETRLDGEHNDEINRLRQSLGNQINEAGYIQPPGSSSPTGGTTPTTPASPLTPPPGGAGGPTPTEGGFDIPRDTF
jgi:hypothetical protein